MTDVKNILSKKQKPILKKIQRGLLTVILITCIITVLVVQKIDKGIALNETNTNLSNAIEEMENNINASAEIKMIESAKKIAKKINSGSYDLEDLAEEFEVSEINIFDADGFISESNNPDCLGYDIRKGEQSMEFMCLYNGSSQYVQKMMPIADDGVTMKKFVGVTLGEGKGFVQIGYSEKDYHEEIEEYVIIFAENYVIGQTGGIAVFTDNEEFVASTNDIDVGKVDADDIEFIKNIEEDELIQTSHDGTGIYEMKDTFEGYIIDAFITSDEVLEEVKDSFFFTFAILILVFIILYTLSNRIIKKYVTDEIVKMADGVGKISAGKLDEKIDVRNCIEFSSLSDDINSTVDRLKEFIKEQAAKLEEELKLATNIQLSELPNNFEAISNKTGLNLFGSMNPAKEIGGDFYDFYVRDDNTFCFLIADVSGKGIPAAMYMMRAKATIREKIDMGLPVDEGIYDANNELCVGNEELMFLTAWQGILDLNSGKVSFATAGHPRVAIKRASGRTLFHKQKDGCVLGSYENSVFEKQEFTLKHGDMVVLYTDGVTEAKNAEGSFYGEDRLLEAIKNSEAKNAEELCNDIKKDITAFVNGAEQFDDITLLAVVY